MPNYSIKMKAVSTGTTIETTRSKSLTSATAAGPVGKDAHTFVITGSALQLEAVCRYIFRINNGDSTGAIETAIAALA